MAGNPCDTLQRFDVAIKEGLVVGCQTTEVKTDHSVLMRVRVSLDQGVPAGVEPSARQLKHR